MIAVTVYLEVDKDKYKSFLIDDSKIENISSDDWLENGDWAKIDESISEIDAQKLEPNEWYQFTFKRVYGDDGSGSMSDLWFELIETVNVTVKSNNPIEQ